MKNVVEFFEGYVFEVTSHTFWVRFEDDFEAQISTSKILPEEQQHIKVGAYFTLTLYSDDSTDFVFSKECWTKQEIDQIHADAAQLALKFKDKPQVL